jgi:ubiquinone/menaquinone biosynthesis C-methylase UbiE
VKGPKVLDIGCGPGDLAIALARRGHHVTAVDISGVAIDQARAKAAREGVNVRFEVRDAARLSLPSAPFDSIFDSGLLHSLNRYQPDGTEAYLALLPGLAASGARLFLLAISREEAPEWGLSEDFLREKFAEPGWAGTRIEPVDVAAEWEGRRLALRGFLLRTTRA